MVDSLGATRQGRRQNNAAKDGHGETTLLRPTRRRRTQDGGRLQDYTNYGLLFVNQLSFSTANKEGGRRVMAIAAEHWYQGETPILRVRLAAAEIQETSSVNFVQSFLQVLSIFARELQTDDRGKKKGALEKLLDMLMDYNETRILQRIGLQPAP